MLAMVDDTMNLEAAISLQAASAASDVATSVFVPLPSSSAIPAFKSSSLLTPVVCDERAIGRLLETLLSRSGMSIEEASRRLGVTSNTIRQYLHGRRTKPSLFWFVRLATLCGASVSIQFPEAR